VLEGISKHADTIRSHLEKQEFQVQVSPSMNEGRKIMEKKLPDFLVIDLNVAEKGFREFYQWILAVPERAEIPRVFISGKMQAALAKQLETENKEIVLLKPLDINRFISTVKKLKSTKGKSPILTKYREQDYFAALIGKQVGSAILKYEIGRGGMGAVFLKAISVVVQVATGLQTAHDARLIHRDIKPANLIMNNKGHVTITDFGLVRPQKKIKQTQTGIVVGTPHYMPPEIASDTALDARSDIYSLGMVFYHLISGHPPFLSNNPMEILMKHLNEPLPDIRKAIPDFPRELDDILERMTAYAPIFDSNGHISGILDVDIKLETFLLELQTKRNRLLIISAIILAVGILLSFLLSRRLVKDLRYLSNITEKISTGMMDRSIKIKSKDEVGELAQSLERMRISLKMAMEMIEKEQEGEEGS